MTPRMEVVMVLLFIVCTPLITMHMWHASTTTPNPDGDTASHIAQQSP